MRTKQKIRKENTSVSMRSDLLAAIRLEADTTGKTLTEYIEGIIERRGDLDLLADIDRRLKVIKL